MSQDTSAYGVDVRYRTGFWGGRPVKTRMHELAAALDAQAREHGAWVRLHYVYPYPHVDELLPLMTRDAAAGGLLPYLDVPFQHASPRILKLMKRPANAEGTLRRIEAWRAARPDLVVRSTFIVGFPGEIGSRVRGAARVPGSSATRSRRLLRLLAGGRRRGQRSARSRARRGQGAAPRTLHGRAGADQRCAPPAARRHMSCRCWSTGTMRTAPQWRAALPTHPRSMAWCACATARRCAPASSRASR